MRLGDKWILRHAVLSDWEFRTGLFQKHLKSLQFREMLRESRQCIQKMEEESAFNALDISMRLKKLERRFKNKTNTPKIMKSVLNECATSGRSRFVLGNEESGHLLNLTRIPDSEGFMIPAYAGNGLKSGLNTLAALQGLRPTETAHFPSWLSEILPGGYSKSLPIYHVDKKLLDPGSGFRSLLQDFILETLVGKKIGLEWIHRPEEPQMLFGTCREKGLPVFSLFIRNSGTEDKLSLYLRGRSEIRDMLERIGSMIYGYLLKNVKDYSKPAAQAERYILTQLNDSSCSWEELHKPEHLQTSSEEIFRLMHARQSLIRLIDTRWELTRWGIICLGNR